MVPLLHIDYRASKPLTTITGIGSALFVPILRLAAANVRCGYGRGSYERPAITEDDRFKNES